MTEPSITETIRQAESLFYQKDWTGLEMALMSVAQAHKEGHVIELGDIRLYTWLHNRLCYVKGPSQ